MIRGRPFLLGAIISFPLCLQDSPDEEIMEMQKKTRQLLSKSLGPHGHIMWCVVLFSSLAGGIAHVFFALWSKPRASNI